jgi:hypothetical protein
MITNPLLEAKYKVQKQLDEEARHDIMKYARNSHRIMTEITIKYRVNFKYTSMRGGYADICGDNIHA